MSKVVIQGNASGTGDFTIAAPNSDTNRTLTLPDEAGEVLVTDGTTLVVDQTNDRVGIGTAAPQELLHLQKTGGSTIRFQNPGVRLWSIGNEGTSFVFDDVTAGAERMRITSSGRVGIGTSSPAYRFEVSGSSMASSFGGTGGFTHILFRNGNGTIGSISSAGTSTAYNTSSDYRLKEDWQPMSGSVDRVKALNPVNFAWKADGSRVDGFLAHEAQAVVPEAVTGTKDEMRTEEYEVTPAVLDDDGNVVTEAVMGTREVPEYQGIDQSKLVPLLTAALQEAITKIETLEARVTALENA